MRGSIRCAHCRRSPEECRCAAPRLEPGRPDTSAPLMFMDPGPKGFQMWACLGPGKCLEPAPKSRKRHCRDCILGDPDETIEHLLQRIAGTPDPTTRDEEGE